MNTKDIRHEGAKADCEADSDEVLRRHNIRPTAVRILVYNAIKSFQDTFSMSDVEDALETVDKSSIFRTLALFAGQHLVHEIEDGSGSAKYCLCRNDHVCGAEEMHCHFYCESCQKTFCLDHTHIPIVHYPDGFELHQINYMMKGLCPSCRHKREA